MKDRALEIVASRPPAIGGVNLLREYVQSRILRQMQQAGAFVPLAFMGGTALRFLYRIARFSEDLDFTVERDSDSFELAALTARLERELTREGYSIRMRVDEDAVVAKAWIGFVGLMAEADLSAHDDQVLWVKLEVDTDPPHGAGLETGTINVFGLMRLQHHDLPSLFAGKIAAVLAREYTKGRDLYDLMWYLSREPAPQPNRELLRNALAQTAPDLATPAQRDWRGVLQDRLDTVDWTDARADLEPFLEEQGDLELIAAATFEHLLRAHKA